ncbi:MAG: polyphosphate kinase 1 [Leptospiraceae bacterium]|nr:polyphosphate kinase 1 [Leptospiraceae bacterium]MDW8306841.1 polyphosphate kinase 1 [Leptospiraceae bacterium]
MPVVREEATENETLREIEHEFLKNPNYYTNREQSWLYFNDRVLEEAQDPSNPLMERLRFLTICESNLDEYYMVRVAGLKHQVANEISDVGPDGLSPQQQLDLIYQHVTGFYKRLYDVLKKQILPELRKLGIEFCTPGELTKKDEEMVERLFRSEIFPVLTPLAIDPGHPFPRLANRSLNLGVLLSRPENPNQNLFAVVQVPSLLPRLVLLPSSTETRRRYIWLEDIISYYLSDLFSGFDVIDISPFKITRDSDLIIDEDDVDDLLMTIQQELRRREKGAGVRLEVKDNVNPEILTRLEEAFAKEKVDVFFCEGPLPLSGYKVLFEDPILSQHTYRPFTPITPIEYDKPSQLFSLIRKNDIFMHHPYHSFSMTEDFINAAADDPKVLGIKMTLYRTGTKSRILDALIRAARNGKQVTALVELKARFDEETNIQWAKIMESEGVHVVYGLMGFKTHCKVAMVVRKEDDKIRRYVHLSTGNYNATTARIYTDMAILTVKDDFGEDVTHLFNSITGYSKLPNLSKIFTSPGNLKKQIIKCIRQEAELARAGKAASIIAKMNSLVDESVIQELYLASQAGVQIDLIVRGICCLRPAIPGISENIRVRSIVGRLLEHSRIFYFHNDGNPLLYLASADWMPRNFNRRIEIMFPVEDNWIRDEIINNILPAYLRDNTKTRILQSDGTYARAVLGHDESPFNAQEYFIEQSRREIEKREQKSGSKKAIAKKEKKMY